MSMVGRTSKYYEEGVESWKSDHDNAMEAMDLEELLKIGIDHYDSLLKRNSIASHITIEDVQDLSKYHINWNKVTEFVLAYVEQVESTGYIIENANALRKRYKESSNFMPQCKKHLEAATRLIDGEGLTLDEAINGLQCSD